MSAMRTFQPFVAGANLSFAVAASPTRWTETGPMQTRHCTRRNCRKPSFDKPRLHSNNVTKPEMGDLRPEASSHAYVALSSA